MAGYLCEVHHVVEYACGGGSGIDNLTFACGAHRQVRPGGHCTRRVARGEPAVETSYKTR